MDQEPESLAAPPGEVAAALVGRRRQVLGAWAWAWACAVLVLTGCSSVITPPQDPHDPVLVYLIVDNMHHGLLLPAEGGGFHEYAYGDWDWYVEQMQSWYHVLDTLLWPTQGAFGCRQTNLPDFEAVQRRYYWRTFHPIAVARADMLALRRELERRPGTKEKRYNSSYDLFFTRDARGYWCVFNCNDMAAEWLERLGCEVSWALCRRRLVVSGG